MKALFLYEIDAHEDFTLEVRKYTEQDKEILIRSAETNYNTLSDQDKKKRLFEIRLSNIVLDEYGDQNERLRKLFHKAGLSGYIEDRSDYDVLYSIGTDTRY